VTGYGRKGSIYCGAHKQLWERITQSRQANFCVVAPKDLITRLLAPIGFGAKVAKSVSKTVKRTKRSQGRPTRNSKSAVGRDELIEATRRLLGEKPPSEIGRLDVARKADVDPALIRYYFGNLGNLMTEVTAMLTREMHGRIALRQGRDRQGRV
jgi:hypothetical protein